MQKTSLRPNISLGRQALLSKRGNPLPTRPNAPQYAFNTPQKTPEVAQNVPTIDEECVQKWNLGLKRWHSVVKAVLKGR